ncbi:hypothetical protein TNCV_2758301 [Trichonephila clavipes]|nr:hypothetical protein TNCV_2758301 [Trichonephila clavipes]
MAYPYDFRHVETKWTWARMNLVLTEPIVFGTEFVYFPIRNGTKMKGREAVLLGSLKRRIGKVKRIEKEKANFSLCISAQLDRCEIWREEFTRRRYNKVSDGYMCKFENTLLF